MRRMQYAVARATPAKPRLVDPQSLVVWHTAPKLLRAEASVAAQFAAECHSACNFGSDAILMTAERMVDCSNFDPLMGVIGVQNWL
jgi:hypothetical protein